MSPDERAIRDLVDTWMKASQAGDTATVLSLMADDGRAPGAGAECEFADEGGVNALTRRSRPPPFATGQKARP